MKPTKAKDFGQIVEALGQLEQVADLTHDIVDREIVVGRGALANLDTKPGPTNAAGKDKFPRCIEYLLKDTDCFSRHSTSVWQQVCEWQLHLLHINNLDLMQLNAPTVKRLDFQAYTWRALKQVHIIRNIADRNNVASHMVGDFKRLSLNPSARQSYNTIASQLAPIAKAKGKASRNVRECSRA